MAQIFGLWQGGPDYGTGTIDHDIEMFNSLEEAVDTASSRMTSGYWKAQEFDYVNRDSGKYLTPCVDETSQITIFLSDPTGDPDPYPDGLVEFDHDSEEFTYTPC